jgi:hypothetical protein
LFAFAFASNGPSDLAADQLSWFAAADAELRLIMTYALWCALLWPQAVSGGRVVKPALPAILCSLALLFTLLGGLAAYQAWLFGPTEFVIDRYFCFVRGEVLPVSGLCCLASSL